MYKKLLSLVLLFFAFQLTYSQSSSIYFQGENINMYRNIDSFQPSSIPSDKIVNNGFYGWVQFTATPSQQIQNSFKSKGFQLINYIENKTYLFYFPTNVDVQFLKESGVKAIIPMEDRLKMSSNVKNDVIGDWALEGNNALLSVQHFKNLDADFVFSEALKIEGLTIKEEYKGSNVFYVSVPKTKIQELVNLPVIKWVETIPEPSVKEDNRGKSIHRSSNLDTQTPGGRNYTGEGIGVLVRDDGIVGPHIDFQGRIDNSQASGTGQTHGDGVAGIMAGSGNLDPTKRGMAAGSSVYIVNYASSFLDNPTTSLINNGDVQITNSSYGDGCNGGYTTTTNTVDTQANNNLNLLHVFSAGNSGTNSGCGYIPGGGAWGNITGGHKQGKNVIATANVFYDGGHVSSSSHGPAYDGRIKPDITAHGQGQLSTNENNAYLSFGGTSGAAPGIAGVSAQLYQLYKDANSGSLPEAALIKATLLNTAQDYGRTGPDYEYGWGLVNGLRAAMLLEDGRYLDAQATQGNTNTHTINVPAGTTQVRFMVYWNDPAASAGSNTALVNDLDLRVKNPSNTEFLPWILNPAPDATTLDDPATNGIDRLNNMEQVLINTPESGDYTIEIEGFNVPQGPQKYYVVYEIVSDELVLTYPQGGEKFVKGQQSVIHWDATNTTEDFTIDYSSNNGGSWQTITTVSSTTKNYTWSVPQNLASGEYLIRVTSGSYTSTSQPFSIANLVSGINVTQVCPETLSVGWTALDDATEYKVYLLGEKYMDEVGTTSSTSFSIPITNPNPTGGFWIAVSASGTNWTTRRSIAINQAAGLFNCNIANDVGVASITNNFSNLICQSNNSIQVSAAISNTGTNPQSNFTISYQLDNGTIVEETYSGTLANGAQETYTFTTPIQITTDGDHTLKVFTGLSGDENASNNEQTLSFYTQVAGAELNVVETLETAFPPQGWTIENPDSDGYTWSEATVTGSDGNSTKVAFMDHADYSDRGRLDNFVTKVYDLTNASGATFSFDLAKAQWSTSYNDKLRVEVSTDCGGTYTSVYEKEGLELSTIANYVGSEWTPSAAGDWRNETIDLAAYLGQKVQIRFVAVNDYSNSTYIDNILLSAVLSTPKENLDSSIIAYPNPVSNKLQIKLTNLQEIKNVRVYSVLGKEISIDNVTTKLNNRLEIDMNSFSTGVYIVKLETNLGVGHKKIIKK